MKCKVMTYNIMSGRSHPAFLAGEGTVVNPSLVASVIKEQNADIVGMNEVHEAGGIFDDQPQRIAKEAGYSYYHFAQSIMDGPSPYGNAILSKYPITETEVVKIPGGTYPKGGRGETRTILKAVIDLGGEKIEVYVTHFGLLPSEQEAAFQAVKALIEKAEHPCILMGDLNLTPEHEIAQALKSLLKDTAPEDICADWYTFSSDEPYEKIDYIFAAPEFSVSEAKVHDVIASDHRPYTAVIKLDRG